MKLKHKRRVTDKSDRTPQKLYHNDFRLEIAGIGIITLAILGTASIFTRAMGFAGDLLNRGLLLAGGDSMYLVLVLLFMAGFKLITEKSDFRVTPRVMGLFILVLVLLTFGHIEYPRDELFRKGLDGTGGGLTGAFISWVLLTFFGVVGGYIILSSITLVSILLITGYTLAQLGVLTTLRAKNTGSRLWNRLFNFLFEEIDENEGDRKPTIKTAQTPAVEPVQTGQPAKHEANVETTRARKKSMPEAFNMPEPELSLSDGRTYRPPPVSILKIPDKVKNEVSEKEVADRSRILENTLVNFGIETKIDEVSIGPAITRYEFQPPPGIKVSRIVGLADDIALSLAVPGVRIEAPIPGKAAVGIEVPNREISPVSMRELLESKDFAGSPSRLTVALGKDIAGSPVVTDLGKMPHLLVAGATGAGKSVCINTIICSILFNATPDEVKLLMVDPKMVELTNYNGTPHLISPVVTDAKKAAGTLRWAVKEMEHRYELFAAAGVRDIGRFNKACSIWAEEPRQPLPFIVIIIDELADMMMVAPADVEDSICRLAQMARAAGIHLVIATQRPSVDVITGLIKANIPSRISFAVTSLVDSRTILDMGGAEKLLGRGDMLFYPVGAAKPKRVQGAFVSDQEVEALVKYLKLQAEPIYDDRVLTVAEDENGAPEDEDYDELLPQAVRIFIENGAASISMLQRRLHIGYARSARLVDMMERRGIVGGFEGSKPRTIKMTLDQYRQVFGDT